MSLRPIRRATRAALAIAGGLLAAAAFAAQGRLGFSINVDTDGLFSTTLKEVTVASVVPGAPAQQAGLMAEDKIEAVNGMAVPGAKGGQLKDLISAVKPGDHLQLTVRRKDGVKQIDIVAGEPVAK